MAFACDARHMLGGQGHIKRGSTQRTQGVGLESPQAVAQHLGCWLKMQEPGLRLRSGELVLGGGGRQRPHSKRHCSSLEWRGGSARREAGVGVGQGVLGGGLCFSPIPDWGLAGPVVCCSWMCLFLA